MAHFKPIRSYNRRSRQTFTVSLSTKRTGRLDWDVFKSDQKIGRIHGQPVGGYYFTSGVFEAEGETFPRLLDFVKRVIVRESLFQERVNG